MTKPVIDLKRIVSELVELAGHKPEKIPQGSLYMPSAKIRVKKGNGARLATRQDDTGFTFAINPKRIRTDQQLQSVISDCRMELV